MSGMERRYADDGSPKSDLLDRKAPRSGPWAGRAWVEQQPEGGWSLTVEPDGETAETCRCDTQLDAAQLALAEPRVAQFYLWSPRTAEFVRHDRTQWAALVGQLRDR